MKSCETLQPCLNSSAGLIWWECFRAAGQLLSVRTRTGLTLPEPQLVNHKTLSQRRFLQQQFKFNGNISRNEAASNDKSSHYLVPPTLIVSSSTEHFWSFTVKQHSAKRVKKLATCFKCKKTTPQKTEKWHLIAPEEIISIWKDIIETTVSF